MSRKRKSKNTVVNNSSTNIDVNLLIEEIRRENDRNNKELERILNDLYEKNKKENEIHGVFDSIIKWTINVIFYLLAFVFLGGIYFVFTKDDTLGNKIVLTIDYVMISFIFLSIGLSFRKEKNRNFILSCFSALIALFALLIAMSK